MFGFAKKRRSPRCQISRAPLTRPSVNSMAMVASLSATRARRRWRESWWKRSRKKRCGRWLETLPAQLRTCWEFDCVVTGDSPVRAERKLGSGAAYENAFVQRRRDLESDPASGGDRGPRVVFLLVWFKKNHSSQKDCRFPRPKNAEGSGGTGGKSRAPRMEGW